MLNGEAGRHEPLKAAGARSQAGLASSNIRVRPQRGYQTAPFGVETHLAQPWQSSQQPERRCARSIVCKYSVSQPQFNQLRCS